MKTLYIIRHADTEKQDKEGKDINRKLTQTGFKQAKDLGNKFEKHVLFPDMIICSPAKRACETAAILANKIGYPGDKIVIEKSLYEDGKPKDILDVLANLPVNINSVYLIGHNPLLSEFSAAILDLFDKKIPKCGVLCIEFHQKSWPEIKSGSGILKFYDYPNGNNDIQTQLRDHISSDIFNHLSDIFSARSYETQKHMKEHILRASKTLGREFVKTQIRKKEKIRKNKIWASSEQKENA